MIFATLNVPDIMEGFGMAAVLWAAAFVFGIVISAVKAATSTSSDE